jgi:hydrogenase expression/formation protein HypE
LSDKVHVKHGDGGKYTNQLIKDMFYDVLKTPLEEQGKDSAVLELPFQKIAYTTDSFVVKPIFFKGGNIGKLAVCGTLNDLAVSGAKPLYMSLAMIIEEGFDIEMLKKIVKSIEETCVSQGVKIVTGDTKVVERGSADEIFINTSGIGSIINDYSEKLIQPGDEVIITGGIGEHGAAIALDRYDLNIDGNIKSDCAPVFPMIKRIEDSFEVIKLMKDPTRGGIASVLNEIAQKNKVGIELIEENIPISNEVNGIAKLLGFDPLYLACEGRILLVVQEGRGENIVRKIRAADTGREAKLIGKITKNDEGLVFMKTRIGGKRMIYMLEAPMLPRIC